MMDGSRTAHDAIVTPATITTAIVAPMVIEAHFLSNRVMSSLKEDRSQPEWPLHPDRLFSALVASLHSLDRDDDGALDFAAAEAAVRWLETIGAPAIQAGFGVTIPAMQTFVPLNDEAVLSKGNARGHAVCLPDSPRRKRVRLFPGVTVDVPVLRYAWQVSPDALAAHRAGLHQVLAHVPYLGRSVNFVLIRLLEVAPDNLPNASRLQRWTPSRTGAFRLRTAAPGRLAHLRQLYAEGRAVDAGSYAFYRDGDTDLAGTPPARDGPWSRVWTAFAMPGCRIDATDSEGVAKAIRRAINARASQAATVAFGPGVQSAAARPVDAFISGHEADRSQSRIERLAVVPLGNVLNPHADGRLLGFALLMPMQATPEQWRLVSELMFGDEERDWAPLAEIRVADAAMPVVAAAQTRLRGLAPDSYVATARRWTTVTPILLSRRPDSGSGRPAHEVLCDRVRSQVVQDCRLAGLPEPVGVEVSLVSTLDGVAPARAFKQCRSGPPRWATHATIVFPVPVAGPILVGAGRYNGLGLLTPDEPHHPAPDGRR